MSLKTNGSYLKAFLADPVAWNDYGGFERVVVAIDGGEPSFDWEADELSDDCRVEIVSGYRLDGDGRRTGCFVRALADWMMRNTAAQVRVELPASICPQLQDWARKFGASCSTPTPAIVASSADD